MTQTEIADKIIPFLVEEFEVEANMIKPEANLNETLQLDSLDYVDLIVMAENSFGIKIAPEDFQNLTTFHDFYSYLDSKINTSQKTIAN